MRKSLVALLTLGLLVATANAGTIFSDDFDDKTNYSGGRLQMSDRIYSGTYTGTWTTVPAQGTGGWDHLGALGGGSGAGYMALGGGKASGNRATANMDSEGSLSQGVTVSFDYKTKPDSIGSIDLAFLKGFDADSNLLFELHMGQNGNENSSGYGQAVYRVGDIYTADSGDPAVDNIYFGERDQWIPIELTLGASSYDLWVDADQDGNVDTGETKSGIAYNTTPTAGLDALSFYADVAKGSDIDNIVVEVVPEPATMSLLVLGGIGVLARRRRRA